MADAKKNEKAEKAVESSKTSTCGCGCGCVPPMKK
jgi:hypothetical protein